MACMAESQRGNYRNPRNAHFKYLQCQGALEVRKEELLPG